MPFFDWIQEVSTPINVVKIINTKNKYLYSYAVSETHAAKPRIRFDPQKQIISILTETFPTFFLASLIPNTHPQAIHSKSPTINNI